MKPFVPLVVFVLLVACSRPELPALASPSGAYFARTEISGDEAGPTKRICVRLRMLDQTSKKEVVYQTSTSDRMKWAIDWSAVQTLVLFSSDIGIHAYDIRDGAIAERTPTETEKEIARNAYAERYGQKPRA